MKYELNAKVIIEISNSTGVVIGRAEYLSGEPSYLIRHMSKTGNALEEWWTEGALIAASQEMI